MTKRLSTIIVDDESLARKGLEVRLKQHQHIDIITHCHNGREAIAAVRAYQPDLMFLDIKMPELDGFQVVESIIKQGLKLPMVIFVTAFDQFALQAFEVHAYDYLLKPIDDERLSQAIDKVKTKISSEKSEQDKHKLIQLVSDVTGNDYSTILRDLDSNDTMTASHYADILPVKDVGKLFRVPVSSILWIEAAGDYMCVHTNENTHILRKTMKQLEAFLNPRQFIRSHRSTILNKNYIDKFCSQINGEYYVVMKNGKELKVSRSYKDKVKHHISM